MIEIIAILVVSVALNVFLILYLRWLLKNFTFLSENMQNLLETAEGFTKHLSAVYELETFYGDETLHNLLTHARQVVEEIGVYKDIYTMTGDEEQLIKDIFNDTEQTEDETEEEN
tara:strand:+ start:253 stop:597 length:345 start_codon:yes stop_codon:yes gene_type:complete